MGTANCVIEREKKKENFWLTIEIKLFPTLFCAKYEWMNKTRILDKKDINSFFFQKSVSFLQVILLTSKIDLNNYIIYVIKSKSHFFLYIKIPRLVQNRNVKSNFKKASLTLKGGGPLAVEGWNRESPSHLRRQPPLGKGALIIKGVLM